MITKDHYTAMLRLLALRAHLDIIVQSSMDWRDKYDLVFRQGATIKAHEMANDAGVQLNWYDPDADYDDDVLAYVRAIHEACDQVQGRWKALPAHQVLALLKQLPALPDCVTGDSQESLQGESTT